MRLTKIERSIRGTAAEDHVRAWLDAFALEVFTSVAALGNQVNMSLSSNKRL